MNTWKNLPGKAWISILALDPFLRRRSRQAAAILPAGEAKLFLAMKRYDLAHAMTVAGRLRDDPLLEKAALLHDAGKLSSDLGLFVRWLYTMLEILMPQRLQAMAKEVNTMAVGQRPIERARSLSGAWKRGLYAQTHHGEIAAELLSGLGSEEELIKLVACHQEEPSSARSRRLREVDDRF